MWTFFCNLLIELFSRGFLLLFLLTFPNFVLHNNLKYVNLYKSIASYLFSLLILFLNRFIPSVIIAGLAGDHVVMIAVSIRFLFPPFDTKSL